MAVVALAAPVALAFAGDGSDALLSRYVDNPAANLRAMQTLGRGPIGLLPSGVALMVGDAFLRAGDDAAAARIFSTVLARREGQPIEGVASIGLGWATFAQGELETARLLFESGVAGDDTGTGSDALSRAMAGVRQVALLTLGLLDAYEGRSAAAALRLEDLATAPGTAPELRPVARLALGYARYWAADYGAAAASFDVAAREFPDAPTADDARYGAAWSRWRAGDRASAIEELENEARERPRGGRSRISRELVELERSEVVLHGLRGDRRAVGSPVQRVAGALDLDGVRLARAALRLLRESEPDDATAEEVAVGVRVESPRDESADAVRAARPSGAAPERGDGGEGAEARAEAPPALRVAAVPAEPDSVAAPGQPATRAARERAIAVGGAPLWLTVGLAATAIGGALAAWRRARARSAAADVGTVERRKLPWVQNREGRDRGPLTSSRTRRS